MRIQAYMTLALILGLANLAFAASKKLDAQKEIDQVMTKYRKASAIKAAVTKTVVQEAMGIESKSEGEFFFSKGKLRLDFSEPEKTTLVYDGKFVWFEARLDESQIQVTKMKTNELKRTRSLLTALFEKKNILRGFKAISSREAAGTRVFIFEPKDKKAESEIQKLEISVKGRDLAKVLYKDQLENTVTFEFKNLTRGQVAATKFSYKPPKNAEITEL